MAITKDDAIKSKIRKGNSKSIKPGATKEKYEPKDYFQELTDKMIKKMEESKESNWEKPWLECNRLPRNLESGKVYRGVNAVALLAESYAEPRWATFAQLVEHCRKNEIEFKPQPMKGKGVAIFRGIQIEKDETGTKAEKDAKAIEALKTNKSEKKLSHHNPDEGNQQKKDFFFMLKYVGTAFNVSYVPSITPWVAHSPEFEPHAEVDLLVKAMDAKGLSITHGNQTQAYYSPSKHEIYMPHPHLFKTPESYYATLLHEMGHATSKELKRTMNTNKFSPEYAFEELVAELTSHFVGAELGVPYNAKQHENQAVYLEGWLSALKEDKTFIFKASAQAAKAAEYQLNVLQEYKMDMGLIPRVEKVQEEPKQEVAPVLTRKEPALAMAM